MPQEETQTVSSSELYCHLVHLSLASSLKSSVPLSEHSEIDLGGGRLIFLSPRLLVRGRRVFFIVGDREADISRGERTTRVLFLVM